MDSFGWNFTDPCRPLYFGKNYITPDPHHQGMWVVSVKIEPSTFCAGPYKLASAMKFAELMHTSSKYECFVQLQEVFVQLDSICSRISKEEWSQKEKHHSTRAEWVVLKQHLAEQRKENKRLKELLKNIKHLMDGCVVDVEVSCEDPESELVSFEEYVAHLMSGY